jgi:shikimate dehydrogenase
MTKRMGIIGYPLGHTLSPVFQRAAISRLGLDATFEAWPTAPDRLAEKVASFRASDMLGVCVTLPHKQAVIPMLDSVHETARAIGAVNWIINGSAGSPDGKLTGYNTDAPGFLRSLKEAAKFDPKGAHAVVFGAGGAARAVVYALKTAGVARLTIANRTLDKARELAASMTQGRFRPAAIGLSRDELANVVPYASLLVNTSSMGMAGGPAPDATPVTADLVPAGALGYDAVYAPLETPFLKEIEKAGGRTASGITMLVYQGAEGFELCTGKKAPVHAMMEAIMKARAGNK